MIVRAVAVQLKPVLDAQDGTLDKIVRKILVGNPLVMKQTARSVPDGVHVSYDTMTSLLAPYGSEDALAVARDLDAKISSLVETAAR